MRGQHEIVRRVIAIVASEDAGVDAAVAISVALRYGAELTLVMARPDAAHASAMADGIRASLASADAIVSPALHIVQGRAAIDAVHLADNPHGDLLMLGRRAALESPGLCDDLLFRARVPVLLRQSEQLARGPVLVATDGDERGTLMLLRAAEFARRTARPLEILTVDAVDAAWPATVLAPLAARTARLLEKVTSQPGCDLLLRQARVSRRQGRVSGCIAREASAQDASLLVLGRRTGSAAGMHVTEVLASWDGATLLVPI